MRDFKRVETLWVNMIELGSQGVEDERDSTILSAILTDFYFTQSNATRHNFSRKSERE
jgi:hypothetical protein